MIPTKRVPRSQKTRGAKMTPTWTISRDAAAFPLIKAVLRARDTEPDQLRGLHRLQVTTRNKRRCLVASDGRRIHIAYSKALPNLGLYELEVQTRNLITLKRAATKQKYPDWPRLIAEFEALELAVRLEHVYAGEIITYAEVWTARLAKAVPDHQAIRQCFLNDIPFNVLAGAIGIVKRGGKGTIGIQSPDFEAYIMPFSLTSVDP